MRIITGSRRLSARFDMFAERLETAKEQIASRVAKEMGAAEAETRRLSDEVNRQFDIFREELEAIRHSAQELASEAAADAVPDPSLQGMILKFLLTKESFYKDSQASIPEIAEVFGMSEKEARRCMDYLKRMGMVSIRDDA
jgi:hypothetical protein